MFSLSVVTPAAGVAITTDEAKEHLRLTHTEDDRYIDGLIRVATSTVENLTARAILSQTLKVKFDKFEKLELPMYPVTSISSVKYYDASGVQITMAGSDYQADLDARPVEVKKGIDLNYWPALEPGREMPIEVQFVAGSATVLDVPEVFKIALKMCVGDLYWNRGNTEVSQSMISAVDLILYPYRLWM